MMYTAIMADIIESKKLSMIDREQVQLFIKECLHALNKIFRPSLEFEVIFSAGDEVQGLFKHSTPAVLYLRLLKMLLAPLQIRCGIGVGEWSIRIPNGTSSEQDGQAYHRARTAISNTHSKNEYSMLFNSENETDIYINTFINTSLLLEKKQSHYQKQLQLITELMYPIVQSDKMDLSCFAQLGKLLQNKASKELDSIENKFNLFSDDSPDFEPFDLSSIIIGNSSLIVANTLKKGLSTKISSINNTSRQNIDKVLKAGNIAEIRNIDVATLLLICRTFSE